MRIGWKAVGVAMAALLPMGVAAAQFLGNGMGRPAQASAASVEFLFPEQINVAAEHPVKVMLHFRVAPGLHINSHRPHDEFLIPTAFSLPEGKGVRLVSASYPEGADVVLPSAPKTKLNVYTGTFEIETRIVAEAGSHLVEGRLRYQACDQRQCMPPKTIPVAIDVIGK